MLQAVLKIAGVLVAWFVAIPVALMICRHVLQLPV